MRAPAQRSCTLSLFLLLLGAFSAAACLLQEEGHQLSTPTSHDLRIR